MTANCVDPTTNQHDESMRSDHSLELKILNKQNLEDLKVKVSLLPDF